ncbi:MAG: hypothetical protein M3Q05_07215 [Bacteroidota bacterium]|nr:hypothetical protein [Bacteroidota bacterium]
MRNKRREFLKSTGLAGLGIADTPANFGFKQHQRFFIYLTRNAATRPDQILPDVYKKASAAEHYKCSFHPGPNKFDAPMQKEAFAWFDRWLKA